MFIRNVAVVGAVGVVGVVAVAAAVVRNSHQQLNPEC